ncbi:hypothetical protein IQ278_20825 [Tolypothrix sp. LEGE 11397]|nr:hypothetical protein [Tolypothrix sp. LEGE 11397]UYD30551.1 hypothetical protein HGR01_36825 [Tolypothrix sp. PCC 7712]UYD38318.1 hypothetical protein HG267_38100 [Tolypothrix sp. PCC 7601]
MNILFKFTSVTSLILLITSGCTPAANTQNLTTSSSNLTKCPDKPEAVLDANKVKTINLSNQKITESGMVSQNKSVGYVFEAQAGQRLVYNTLQDVCIAVYTPENRLLNSGVLPITGKYTVQIFILKGSTTFDLAMNLESKSTSPPTVTPTTPTVTPTSSTTPLATTPPSLTKNTNPSPISTSKERFSSFTNNNVSRPSPTEVIKDYYAKINNRQYRSAWNILPVELQEDKELHPNGYSSFLDWYRDKVDFINIHNIYLAESNKDYATVKMSSTYYMRSGRKAPINLNFYMVWNESQQKWELSKTKIVN